MKLGIQRTAKCLIQSLSLKILVVSVSAAFFSLTNQNVLASNADQNANIYSELSRGVFLEPQSKTVITRDDIEKSGARTVIDLLRQIPGLVVDQISGSDFRINYLGGPSYKSRRLQVLIDGVSHFLPNLARVKVSELPISINDLQKVEFVHGPSTALYQENAFSGTLNFITRDPRDEPHKLGASMVVGSQDTESLNIHWASNERLDRAYRTSFNFHSDEGFDSSDFTDDAHDSTKKYSIYHRSFFQLTENAELDLVASYFEGDLQRERDNSVQSSIPESEHKNYSLSLDMKKRFNKRHSINLSAYYLRYIRENKYKISLPLAYLTPAARFLTENTPYLAYDVFVYGTTPIENLSPEEMALVAPVLAEIGVYGLQETEGDLANQRSEEQVTDLEFSYKYLKDDISIYTGFGVKHKLIDNPLNYFNEQYYLKDYRYVFNTKKLFGDRLAFNLGFLFEDIELVESSFSPRTSLVYRVDQRKFIRFTASHANRNPNLYELRHNTRLYLTNLNPLFEGSNTALVPVGLKGNPDLNAEEIDSYSFSYTFKSKRQYLEWRLFYNEYENLISEILSDDSFSSGTNSTDARRKGSAIEYKLTNKAFYLRLGYVYQDSSANSDTELDMDFRHSGSIGLGYFLNDYQFNIGYTGHNINYTGSFNQYHFGTEYKRNNFSIAYQLTYLPQRKLNEFTEPSGGVQSLTRPVYYNDASSHFITLKYMIP